MRLSAVYFDDTVCIPGGKDVGGGMARQDLRESTFSAADGWDITMLTEGGVHFSIFREGMERACIIGGYGYTYVTAPPKTFPATSDPEEMVAMRAQGSLSAEQMQMQAQRARRRK
jgi:hypothetical protein